MPFNVFSGLNNIKGQWVKLELLQILLHFCLLMIITTLNTNFVSSFYFITDLKEKGIEQQIKDRHDGTCGATHPHRVCADYTITAPCTVHITQGLHGNIAWPCATPRHCTKTCITAGSVCRCPVLLV